jgi:exodeoxyribonuclease VII large subunit
VHIKKIFTVSELNKYVKRLVEEDSRLSNLWIKGEISNFKKHSSGHLYFVLKDPDGLIRCVMFRSRASKLVFLPDNGTSVIIRGHLSVFERDGIYQLYVEEIQPEGIGALQIAFEQLKIKLEKEGLFDVVHKKELPLLPQKIGVVTSPSGAVWHDIQKVALNRFPNICLVLAPTSVQGDNAPAEISRAIERLNQINDLDVIIVGRGGGSLEELWAFNTETVARSIYLSKVPIVSAVGHETDFTIADFVADKRAATPSAAAEMVVPVKLELERLVKDLSGRMEKSTRNLLGIAHQQVAHLKKNSVFLNPERMLYQRIQNLDMYKQALERNIKSNYDEYQKQIQFFTEKINMLNPLNTLSRGYAICRLPKSKNIIVSTEQVENGDNIEVFLAHGGLNCQITKKIKGDICDGR